MDEKEKLRLKKLYEQMPEEELAEMLMIDEKEYEEGIYQLLLDAAKFRNLGIEKKEIIDKAVSLQQEAREKIATEKLTPGERKIFTIFPGIAFWASIFTPEEYKQKKKQINLCQLTGLRNFFILCFVCGVFLLFALNENQITTKDKTNLIFTCIGVMLAIIGISFYLRSQNKKQNKNPITKQSS